MLAWLRRLMLGAPNKDTEFMSILYLLRNADSLHRLRNVRKRIIAFEADWHDIGLACDLWMLYEEAVLCVLWMEAHDLEYND